MLSIVYRVTQPGTDAVSNNIECRVPAAGTTTASSSQIVRAQAPGDENVNIFILMTPTIASEFALRCVLQTVSYNLHSHQPLIRQFLLVAGGG